MRNRRLQPRSPLASRPDARRAGSAGRDCRARNRRCRVRLSGQRRRPSSSSSGRPRRSCSSTSRCRTDASELLVHVRDFTKGHPSVNANNHPIRHGPVVGVHNGRIANDDELLADHPCARAEPRMTVDSEAVFAAGRPFAATTRRRSRRSTARWRRPGSTSAGPGVLYLARGVGRPLWLGEWQNGVVFASTEYALGVARAVLRPELRKRELGDGTVLAFHHGRVVSRQRFRTPKWRRDGRPPGRRRPAGARLLPQPPGVDRRRGLDGVTAAEGAVREDRPRPARPGGRGRGTGTSTRRRGASRTCGTPATRSAARGGCGGRPTSRRTSAAGRARRASSTPCSTARSSRSSPIVMS